MLYGETGKMPIRLQINKRIIAYWCKIILDKDNKLISILYKNLLYKYNNGTYKSLWLDNVKNILDKCGLSYVWQQQGFLSKGRLLSLIETRLKDQFRQEWNSNKSNTSKGKTYNCIKPEFNQESYMFLPKTISLPLLKFRTANHLLPVERGRWRNIPYLERYCSLCQNQCVGDEYHVLFECPAFLTERKLFLKQEFIVRPNFYKFNLLFKQNHLSLLRKLSKFVRIIMDKFKEQ